MFLKTAKTFLPLLFFVACKTEKSYEPVAISPGIIFRTMTDLPKVLEESSGIEALNSEHFISMNDSKGKAKLYVFDTLGELSRTIKIKNTDNVDWEDLAQDTNGDIYIGDFGNNDNERKDLNIYRIPSMAIFSEEAVDAESISFVYENQTEFPPHDSLAFFDSEAFFVFRDSFFLFIKDRSKPIEGKTLMYQFPVEGGKHTAVLKGEIATFKNKKEGAITAADISPSGLKMVLISQKNVWIFSNFSESNFFDGKVRIIPLAAEHQMEGVLFLNDCLLYLTSEKSKDFPSALHELRICD